MSKTILFINDYAGSPYHGMEFRNYYFAKELVKQGYKVYIITASYSHLFKKLPQTKGIYTLENINGINYLWIKVPKYSSSTDKKRVLKWFIFSFLLNFLPKSIDKPDFVIASPMATMLVKPAYKLAKKYNAKFIYEVKDIWPLSIIELGNISQTNPLIKLMKKWELFALKNADGIVSSLQNYGEYLKYQNINREWLWANNGIDLEQLQNIKALNQEILKQIPKDKFIVGYTGTIGIANAIDTLCKSAKILANSKDIHFIIVGDGKERDRLIKEYGDLENLTFIEPIAKEQVQSILQLFDICYIGWQDKKIYCYGISANKIFDYMFSSKPILHAYNGNVDIIKLANCGISVEAQNPEAIVDGIKKLYYMSKENRDKLGKNGKKYVLEYFTYEKLAKKYIKRILND